MAEWQNMVLVKTVSNLPLPDSPTTKLVVIAAFVHQYIAGLKAIAVNLGQRNGHSIDRRKINMPVLNIGNSQIWQVNSGCIVGEGFPLGHPALGGRIPP
ncbi:MULTISPECIES: hypothetical protein [unclassified Ectothiorhodospira]|uniref:hypothetical protein n=1 Tax=unclassified Ectothiorhodospira TaxID=2684909 RepID=UPI001EE9A398|nr:MULTISPECIES: hypothetical protein [unclassified Ectothiorhodospira]MCG5516015.1 hypothetical protein [Ectothiorhodospira sp. 9100]MCG5519029.1 hypothetical protein [Ectothiorhodospira sp. 9905]